MRESPAIELIKELIAEGAVITAYDPVAMDEARQIFTEHIHYADSAQACLTGQMVQSWLQNGMNSAH